MKHIRSFFLAALMATAASFSAFAEDIDMAAISCEEFLADDEGMPLTIMWIDGYMSAKGDNTIMSEEWIEKLGEHMGTYCAKNPKKTIMDAVEAMPEG